MFSLKPGDKREANPMGWLPRLVGNCASANRLVLLLLRGKFKGTSSRSESSKLSVSGSSASSLRVAMLHSGTELRSGSRSLKE